MENKILFSAQCTNCLKILGVSEKDLNDESIFCLKCAKEILENENE